VQDATAAARAGAETLLIEQCNCLDGIATAGDPKVHPDRIRGLRHKNYL